MTLGYRLLAIAAVLAVTSCGSGNGGGPSTPMQPSPPPPAAPPAAPLEPTFTSIRTQVIQVWCVGCHTGIGRVPDGQLRLDANTAYGELVNVPSVGKPSAGRVVPGNPDGSYLIHKLEGRADIVGARMPMGGPFLSQADIAVIRTWIAQGAQNN